MTRDLVFNVLILAVDVLFLRYIARHDRPAGWATAGAATVGVMLVAGLVMAINLFHALRLYSFAMFLHVPLILLGTAILLRRRARVLSVALGIAVLMIAAAGIDAFFVEPTALEINRVRIETSKITRPLRITVVSDLQTDRIGDYERRVLSEAMKTRPDVVLMPGDYIHAYPMAERRRVAGELRSLMRELRFDAPLGVFAVRGNVERDDWPSIFEGLPVTTLPRAATFSLGPISLTGLGFSDSFNRHLRVPDQAGFHVVFGHAPDFALGDNGADLLIAGHTHGGQVRLPLIGPLITFSRVPRSWAAGVTRLSPGKTLVVSRGVGMERGYAPRMRFLCRPELVVIDLVPEAAPETASGDSQ